ncbi:MAG: exodeoxyribonuclease VII large subunit [Deltaproteobacteria bacterium]|nr:exodeoxyribonuclease VII large subunit [Deltaproteobacteria bacterium]
MARIPFTVDIPNVPPDSSGESSTPPADRVWSVSGLTRQIRGALEQALPHAAVEGEISNLKRAASGHLYFNLKDSQAQLRCVMFRGAAQSLRFQPQEGMQVVARGKITVYDQRGEYQLQTLVLEPLGAGALQAAFEQLKARLAAEGLFDPARKRPLPLLPRGIGIVTSPQGAAIRDMLTVLARRFPSIPVVIAPAAVQGEQAAGEIARGIEWLNRLAEGTLPGLPAQPLDVLIVGRGGGSVEDLWAFNEERVARAVFHSRLPVISAVGHEVDFTIADFTADVRAPTPSAAAELAVPDREALRQTVAGWRERMAHVLKRRMTHTHDHWEHLRARLGTPEGWMARAAQRVDGLQEALERGAANRLALAASRADNGRRQLLALRPDRAVPLLRRQAQGLQQRLAPALHRAAGLARERLTQGLARLDAVSPLATLRRGYATLADAQGKPVTLVAQTTVGETLTARLADGTLETQVRQVHPKGSDV